MRIIQLFNWKLSSVEKELDNIQSQGFDTIIINPMQGFKHDDYFHWWDSYQPTNFEIGNCFGNEKDLIQLCKEAKKRNINIITEVVCDRLAGTGMGYKQLSDKVDSKLKKEEFYKPDKTIQSYDDRKDATTNSLGLPTLNLTNIELQKIVFAYLEKLRKCGVKGYLFNGVKHIGFPNDGVDFFKKVDQYSKMTNTVIMGEFLGGDLDWRDEASKYMNIFTHYKTNITDKSKKIAYIENPSKYLDGDYHYDYLNGEKYINEYEELCKNNSNTSVYIRANKDTAYYLNNGYINHYFDPSSRNEELYFDDTIFKNKKVMSGNIDFSKEKEIEEQKYKSLIKKLF